MSTWAAVRIVWKKELTETLRDRKTLLIMVVLPLVLYPVLMLGMAAVTLSRTEARETETLYLGTAGAALPAEIRGVLAKAPHVVLVPVTDAAGAVRAKQVHAALSCPFDATLALEIHDQVALTLAYDSSDERSRELERRVQGALAELGQTLLAERLDRLGLRREVIEPVAVEARDTAPPARRGGWVLAQFLPFLVSMLMIGATFYPAIDFTAGEKERGTLQTLLTAPVTPLALCTGKYLAITVLALASAFSNLAAMGLVAVSMPWPQELESELSFDLGPGVWLGLLGCLLLLGMTFGGLVMAVAVTAKGFKDAQHYLTPVTLVGVFPLMVAAVPGSELGPVGAAIPLYNLALAMRGLLTGDIQAGLLVIVLASSLVWVALALILAARMFGHEAVLLGDPGLKALFLRRDARGERPPNPTLGEAVTLLGVSLLLQLYFGPLLLSAPLLVALAVAQVAFVLGPGLVLVRVLRLSWRETFAWRRPPWGALASGLLIGLGSWVAAHLALGPLVEETPPPGPVFEAIEAAIATAAADPLGVVGLFVGVSVLPALCEEALFRGVLLAALRGRVRTVTAVVLSALAFSAFHLNPLQMPVTLVLGLVLGALVVRSGSLWPAVACHAVHNGGALAWGIWGAGAELGEGWPLALLLGPMLGAVLWVTRATNGGGAPAE
jgi:sodium transport system permease protein